MTALHELSVAELARALRTRVVSSVEITRAYLERIMQHQQRLNAFISVLPEAALEQASEADARLRAGEAGALIGVPIAHKDIFCTSGHRTTCGSRMLADFLRETDEYGYYELDVERRSFRRGRAGDDGSGGPDAGPGKPGEPLMYRWDR